MTDALALRTSSLNNSGGTESGFVALHNFCRAEAKYQHRTCENSTQKASSAACNSRDASECSTPVVFTPA